MDAAAWAPIITPIVTLLLGYFGKAYEDRAQNDRAVAREREMRIAARRDLRATSRITFQRETLLALQEAAQKLARASGRAQHLDLMASRQNGRWGRQLLPPDLDDELLTTQTQTNLLASRVRDEAVRTLAQQFKTAAVDLISARSEAEAIDMLRHAIDVHTQLNGRIGEVIRSIDDDDDGGAHGNR